jgi:hypothetical protein
MANAGDTDIPVRWLSATDTPLRRVILESPYAGDIERNVAYARAAMRDSLLRGEAPIASHLLYTQPGVLDDQVSDERRLGIEAGLVWRVAAEAPSSIRTSVSHPEWNAESERPWRLDSLSNTGP